MCVNYFNVPRWFFFSKMEKPFDFSSAFELNSNLLSVFLYDFAHVFDVLGVGHTLPIFRQNIVSENRNISNENSSGRIRSQWFLFVKLFWYAMFIEIEYRFSTAHRSPGQYQHIRQCFSMFQIRSTRFY